VRSSAARRMIPTDIFFPNIYILIGVRVTIVKVTCPSRAKPPMTSDIS
jgi:hypothetical protein